MANNYYDLGTSKNAIGDAAHPIDSYTFWKTTKAERDAAAALMDAVMNDMTCQDECYKALTSLLNFVIEESRSDEAFNNAGADQ